MPLIRVRENEPFDISLRRFKRACEKAAINTNRTAVNVSNTFFIYFKYKVFKGKYNKFLLYNKLLRSIYLII